MRKRRNDYIIEVTDEYEGFWCRNGAKSRGYRYYHLILQLHKDYKNNEMALVGLRALEPILGAIPHYSSPAEEELALSQYEKKSPYYECYGVINSKLRRTSKGWIADLWLLRELEDWSILMS